MIRYHALNWALAASVAMALSATINLDLGPDDLATEAAIAADVADAQAAAVQIAQVQP